MKHILNTPLHQFPTVVHTTLFGILSPPTLKFALSIASSRLATIALYVTPPRVKRLSFLCDN